MSLACFIPRLSPCSLLSARSLFIPRAYFLSPCALPTTPACMCLESMREGGMELECQAANRGAGQTAADFAHAYDVGAMAAARRLSAFLRNTAHRRSATGLLRPLFELWRGQQQWPQEARHHHRGTELPACAESGERAGGRQARVVNVSQGGKVTSQDSSPPGVGSRCGGARGSAPADGAPPSPRPHQSADLVRPLRVSSLASLTSSMQVEHASIL